MICIAVSALTNGEDEVCLAEHTHAWNSPLLRNSQSIQILLEKASLQLPTATYIQGYISVQPI